MKIIDLFCGAGGMSLGFAQAGYSVVGAVDNWEPAVECYRKNLKCNLFYRMDLSDWKSVVEKFQGVRADVIVGGPPCQDFSEAGEKVEGDRANLTRCFARIIHKLRPTYFVMENVPPAVESRAYKTARGIFKRSGYGLTEVVLDASLCGVPQSRKRFFCIGSLRDKNRFLLKTLFARQSDIPMSLRDYIGDEFGFNYYYRHPRTYGRRGVYTLDEPAPTIRGVNRPLPKKYKKHPSDLVDPHKYKVRALSFKERARVQMFPSNYVWTEQASCNDQMIGKASGIYVGKDINGNEVKVPYKLTGWIGIHCTINKKDGALNDKDFMNSHFYNPSQLRLYVRNKLAMENFLNVLNSTATYANYIEGEIHFDLLDDDQLTDIATSNRQGVDEHDMRVSRLVEILAPIVRSLINKRTALAAQMKQEADKIRRSRESIAKENFSKEVGEDLASCRNLSPQERADLTTQIANKICGDVVVKTDRVVFFSHSSYDKPFGDFFFELLKSVGVDEDEMFYTSRDDNPNSYEDLRPLSEQIKSCMVQENTLLFYLIGHRYNRSQFCLFEGGAGWATRTTGNYPVLAIKYEHIPKFLTNGKNEMALYDFKRRSISLDKNNYQKIVLILNRIIEHINKGRQCRQKKTIPMFACVRFPNKVELRRAGKSEVDYMDKRILSFWESYVAPELKDYLRDMRKSCCS